MVEIHKDFLQCAGLRFHGVCRKAHGMQLVGVGANMQGFR